MPDIGRTEDASRKLLPIIYVLDCSGSMKGNRISAVNDAMKEIKELLTEISAKNPAAELKIGVMSFSDDPEWITNGLVYLDDYFWRDLVAEGVTNVGKALTELDSKLSRKGFLQSDVGFKAPVIIFMSDGYPTDKYQNALDALNANNKWFQTAVKIGIAVSDDADRSALANICGSSRSVISIRDTQKLKELIKIVSVSASKIGSKSKVGGSVSGEILHEVYGEIGMDVPPPDDFDTFDEEDFGLGGFASPAAPPQSGSVPLDPPPPPPVDSDTFTDEDLVDDFW